MTPFDHLLDASDAVHPDLMLSIHLDHSIDEVADWHQRPEIMMDGLSRSRCDDLVHARTLSRCGAADLAATISETISTIVPIARTIEEVDVAIDGLSAWYAGLMRDDLFRRVVEVKRFARDVDLLDQDPDSMDAETRRQWRVSIGILQQHVDAGETTLRLGGHEVIVTIEPEGVDVMVQEKPGGEDYLALYSLSYPDRDEDSTRNDRDPGPPGPEPEPADGRTRGTFLRLP